MHIKSSIVVLETVQHYILRMTDFLIDEEFFHVRALIAAQLNDFASFLVFLDRTVARKILLECLAYALNIEIVGKASHSRNTLSPVSLLDTDVDLFFGRCSALIARILERVWKKEGYNTIETCEWPQICGGECESSR